MRAVPDSIDRAPHAILGRLISRGRVRSGIVRDQKPAARDPSLSDPLVKLSGAARNFFDAVADAFGLDRLAVNGRTSFDHRSCIDDSGLASGYLCSPSSTLHPPEVPIRKTRLARRRVSSSM